MTDWKNLSDDLQAGLGLRTFLVDGEDVSIFELGSVEFDPARRPELTLPPGDPRQPLPGLPKATAPLSGGRRFPSGGPGAVSPALFFLRSKPAGRAAEQPSAFCSLYSYSIFEKFSEMGSIGIGVAARPAL